MTTLDIVTLCTGNAARSVMLGYMLQTLSDVNGVSWGVRTAGTHAIEGQAMSPRTLASLEKVDDLGEHHYTAHRSHQITRDDVLWADVIIAVEADHVSYMATHFPEAHGKVVQLRTFCLRAPLDGPPAEQVAAVASHGALAELDVPDPAGGDQETYDACARELWDLAQVFATLIMGDDAVV